MTLTLFKLPSILLLLSFSSAVYGSPRPMKRGACDDGVNTASDSRCCALFPVFKDLQDNVFKNECGKSVRKALRSAFHDAIGFSQSGGSASGGGADGSLIAFSDVELPYRANEGLREYIETIKPYAEKYGLPAGDLLYAATAIGLSNCQGAPRLNVYLGRPSAALPSPDGLIPAPIHDVDTILSRMADAGFSAQELVALMSSHSVAASDTIDPTIPGIPLDTTPARFDSQFFIETSLKGTTFPGTGNNAGRGEVQSPLPTELRMKSDFALARDPRTSCQWQEYTTDQAKMRSDFKEVMTKLMTLGQNKDALIDCSDVIPNPAELKSSPHFPADLSIADVDQSCPNQPFPQLPTGSEDDSSDDQDTKPEEPANGDSSAPATASQVDPTNGSPKQTSLPQCRPRTPMKREANNL